ncbi:MAG: hypothetical protein Q7S08_01410 [bacterium]|nr:hypothetical protein [bacterium]
MAPINVFFSHIPIDWIIIAVFAIIVAFDAMRSGSGRATSFALSLPATLFIVAELPHAKFLSGVTEQFTSSVLKALLFGIVFVVTYILVRRMSAPDATDSGQIIQAIVAGIAATAVAIVVWLQVPELQSVWHFGAQIQAIFGEAYRFWWIAGSFAALAFVRD